MCVQHLTDSASLIGPRRVRRPNFSTRNYESEAVQISGENDARKDVRSEEQDGEGHQIELDEGRAQIQGLSS